MKASLFVGREPEMARLKGLLSTRSANLIVVRGEEGLEKAGCLLNLEKK